VNLVMEQPEGIRILPGMAGRASAVKREPGEEEGSTIVVPITAIFSPEQGDQSFVWVVDAESNTVSRREVPVGELVDTGVPVLDGLEPGDWVVTAGVSYLEEGQKVKLMEGKGY
jgi:multidrug efflux pump subunit AcrA (membrane-fusion protein)